MSQRRNQRSRYRFFGACLAGTLAVAACGPSESSNTGGNRVKNAAQVFFAQAVDGVARNKIGDVTLAMPLDSKAKVQEDGSRLVAVTSLVIDSSGVGSEVVVARLGANGQFDETYGQSGVRKLKFKRPIVESSTLTDDGHVLVEAMSVQTGVTVGVTKVNVATGETDPTFGDNGFVPMTSGNILSDTGVVDDGDGAIVLSYSDEISSGGYQVKRLTGTGDDLRFGNGGIVEVPVPTYSLGAGQAFSCNDPTLWPEANGTLSIMFGCVLTSSANQDGNIVNTSGRRVVVTRQIDRNGSAVGSGDAMAFLDGEDGQSYSSPIIFDVVDGDDAASRYVTIDSPEARQVVKLVDNYSAAAPSGLPDDGHMPRYMYGSEFYFTDYVFQPIYIHGDTPRVLGLGLNDFKASMDLGVGEWRGIAEDWFYLEVTSTIRVGDYPMLTHDVDTMSFINGDVFANLKAKNEAGWFFFRPSMVNQSGYMKIGRDGVTAAPYGSAKGMALSPLNDGFPVPDSIVESGIFPANDGTLVSFAFTPDPWVEGGTNDGLTFHVQRYNASGEESGEVTSFRMNGLWPSFWWDRMTSAFDGEDSLYFTGFTSNEGRYGVAKLSISEGTLDTTFGTNGFATLPLDENGYTDWRWYGARIQIGANGSIDLTSSVWDSAPDLPETYRLEIQSIRLTANGEVDPDAGIVEVPFNNILSCACYFDWWFWQLGQAATVDPDGRLLVSFPRMTIEQDGEDVTFEETSVEEPTPEEPSWRFLGGGEVRRYLRNGEIDPSFGVEGVGGVNLYELGASMPISFPRITVDPQGFIFLNVNSLDLRIEESDEDFDIAIDGEFAYSVMLDSQGNPVDFVPRKVEIEDDPIVDLIRDSRSDLGLGEPTSPPPPASGEAPTQPPAATPLPPSVVEINQSDVPIITVVGTPADRTIDVRWSIPESLAKGKASYTVTASPGGKKCTTTGNSCVFKKLQPWTSYTFTIKAVRAASVGAVDSKGSIPVKPVRVLKRGTRIAATKLITPASKGRATWKATGGCKVTKDGKSFTALKDAGTCTLSVTTAKSGKTPKTTRSITVMVRAVAK